MFVESFLSFLKGNSSADHCLISQTQPKETNQSEEKKTSAYNCISWAFNFTNVNVQFVIDLSLEVDKDFFPQVMVVSLAFYDLGYSIPMEYTHVVYQNIKSAL